MSSIVEENIKGLCEEQGDEAIQNKKNEIPDGWHEVRLNDVCDKITQKNNIGNDNVLTISAQHGFINQQKFYNKSVAGANLSTYYLLNKGEFGYNRSYSNGYPMGAIKRLDNYKQGIVSTLYLCFKFGANTDSDFINYYFAAGRFNKEIYKIAQEGARNHGLLNVTSGDFFNGTIVIPKQLKEQEAVANILSGADEVIEATKEKIDLLKRRKDSLMQKLLAPKPHWVEKKLGDVCKITMGQSPLSEAYNENEMGLPLIQGNTDVKNRFSKPRFWTSDITKKCYPDDILMSVRAPVGEIAISKHEACIGRGMCAVAPIKNKAIQGFIYQFLISYEVLWQKYSQGSTFTAVNSNDIRKLKVFIPPTTEEQEQIASILSTCDEEINLYEQKLKILEKQKKGLMQKLLTGTWRVNINKEAG